MRSLRRAAPPVVLALMTAAGAALAADSGTVLPFTGGFLSLGEKNNRAVFDYAWLIASTLRVGGSVSAPMDTATREAAFVEGGRLAPGFAASISVTYDGVHHSLTQDKTDERLRGACGALDLRGQTCTDVLVAEEQAKLGAAAPAAVATYAESKRARAARSIYFIPKVEQPAFFFIGGGELSLAVDSISAVGKDPTSAASSLTAYRFAAGLTGTVIWPSSVALTVKVGFEESKSPRVRSVQLCTPVPAADTSVAGTSCSTVNQLVADPPAASSGYVHAALTYLFRQDLAPQVIPGVELQGRLDNLGQGALLTGRLTAFVTPTSQAPSAAANGTPLIGRLGVGIEIPYGLEAAKDGSYSAHELQPVRLLAVVGAGF